MRTFIKGSLLLLLVVIVTAGCSLLDASERNPDQDQEVEQPDGVHENEVSPTPEEVEEPVKQEITFYYADDDLMDMYRVKQDVEADEEDGLPKAALELWLQGPEQEGLTNLTPPEVVIEKVEFIDGVAHVSFSQEIKNANLGSGGEAFLIDQITLIMEQFGYDSTQILVNGEAEESILGHVTTSEPVSAPDSDSYEWYEE